jgi:serine/threonine-protein kinase RsbT
MDGVAMTDNDSISLSFDIPGDDFTVAGEASSNVKRVLSQLGISPQVIKKTAIAMYEAEINAVIHAGGGKANIEITADKIVIKIEDNASLLTPTINMPINREDSESFRILI